ncbi:MAG: saccharopine dehydrogenase C-terminal domain-containing protein [Elusimicrobiota bacterium]
MKIAVVGAFGQMGEACLYDLCASPGVTRVLAADRTLARSRAVLRRIPRGRKARAIALDLASPAARRKLAGSKVLVNCAWYEFNLEAMKLALALKAHYVDLGGLYHMALKQLRLHPDFRRAGRTAVLGCGSTPGITNMMAARLAGKLDRLKSLKIYNVSQDPSEPGGDFLPPFSIRTMLDEGEMPAPVLSGGRLKTVPAFSAEEAVSFPPPFGRGLAGALIHSELATLPAAYKKKGLKDCFFKLVYPEAVRRQLSLLMAMGFSSEEPMEINGARISPRDFLTGMALKGLAKSTGIPQDVEMLRVVAEGSAGGKAVAITSDCSFRSAFGLSAGAMGVGFPASIAAQMAAAGSTAPGAFAPESVLPVDPFFKELERRKIFRLKSTARKGGRSNR